MKNNIKILQTPIRFYPYIGGVENHVLYLSKYLVRNALTVKVICSNEPNSNLINIDGISVERLKYIGKITNTNISFTLPFRILQSKFDLIHTHMPTPWTADWSVLLAKIMKKKSIITIHNDMDKSSIISKLVTKFYLNTFFKITLGLADKIIIVNPDWMQSFKASRHILKLYKEKISIVTNGVELSQFSRKTTTKDNNTIIFVSILDKHHKFKGFDYLLNAIATLQKTNSKIKLLVIGEGELKNVYQKRAIDLGLENNIRFIGKVTQKNLASYYKMASAFVLPSIEIEGFGIVLLEAMASGLPVITTPIAGVWKDIKRYNTGLIVKEKDSSQLANAINRILNNKKLATRMGQNGYKLIKAKYDWAIISHNIEKLYKEVLQ